jgi:hypothetical protein
MKRYSPTDRRNHGRPLKRLLDTWDWNGSTSGPTPWQIDDDDHHHSLCNFQNPFVISSSICPHVSLRFVLKLCPFLFLIHTNIKQLVYFVYFSFRFIGKE